jgi:hypothetical protein
MLVAVGAGPELEQGAIEIKGDVVLSSVGKVIVPVDDQEHAKEF